MTLRMWLSRPGAPYAGLSHPWDLEVVGDYAYVADNTAGLVTLDMRNQRTRHHWDFSGVGGHKDVVVADGYAWCDRISQCGDLFLGRSCRTGFGGLIDPVAVARVFPLATRYCGWRIRWALQPSCQSPTIRGHGFQVNRFQAMAVASSGQRFSWRDGRSCGLRSGCPHGCRCPPLSALYFPEPRNKCCIYTTLVPTPSRLRA